MHKIMYAIKYIESNLVKRLTEWLNTTKKVTSNKQIPQIQQITKNI